MEVLPLQWKSNLICQLKEHNRQWNSYNELIENYQHVLESKLSLETQCIKLESSVQHLRLTNAGLEKASEASQQLANVSSKLTMANDELVTHLREKSELAREVLRLNHALEEINEKLAKEEIKAQTYKAENDEMREKLKAAESEINELTQTKQIVQEEFQALQHQIDQLLIDNNRIKPAFVELEQQLQTAQRLNKHLEDELILSKHRQAEMHDFENERFRKTTTRAEQPRQTDSNVHFDDDMVIIPPVKGSGDGHSNSASGYNNDLVYNSSDEYHRRERRTSSTGSNIGRENLFSSFMRKLTTGINPTVNDKLYRTSTTCCTSASVPAREVTRWDSTDLEVYALQFQPSGSILATGCSDKMIHMWEISLGGQHRKYCSLHGSHGAINALDFDNEGSRLLAGCSGDKAYIWSYAEQRMLKDTFTGHQGLIYTCKFISGTKLATGSADRTIKVWDLHSRQCIRTLLVGSKCHDLVVTDAAGTLISGHYDKKIRIWDSSNDTCRKELQYDAAITSLSYNEERQLLLACLKDDTLKLIDLRQCQTIYTFSHDNFKVSTDTTRAVLSPDGHYACAGSQDGSLVVWNTDTKQCENVLERKHKTMITSVAWQPDGKYVASCEKHRQVILWSD